MTKTIAKSIFLVFAILYISASATTLVAQTSNPPGRDVSEKAIRVVVYENAMAAQTGDVKLYRKHIAKRTMELQRLIYIGFQEVPDANDMLKEHGLDTLDKFIDSTFVVGANQYANLTLEKKQENARAQSTGQVIFLNDREAVIKIGDNSLHLVWEDNEWKVDETEVGKKMYLENFPFTPATRAKIEKL